MKVDYRYAWLIIFLFLMGCQNAPVQPRESLAGVYTTIETLAESVTVAKRDGLIDAEKRDSLVEHLQAAKNTTDQGRAIINEGGSAEGNLAEARQLLIIVRQALIAAGAENE